jgi:hypothetical protein
LHIETVDFSAVALQGLDDVFSTDYDKYLIIISTTSSANANLTLRLRVAGSDDSSSNYKVQNLSAGTTSVTASQTTGTSFNIMQMVSADTNSAITTIFNPFLTLKTGYISNAQLGMGIHIRNGFFDDTTSFTGFRIIAASGTITGQVSVYGYAKV